MRTNGMKHEYFVSLRAKCAYIASFTRPDLSVGLAQLSQCTNSTTKEGKRLKKLVDKAKTEVMDGLRYIKLDIDTTKLVLFADASFVNNTDMTSQLGFVITMVDEERRANLIEISSVKGQRVTRIVLASELIAYVRVFDTVSTTQV